MVAAALVEAFFDEPTNTVSYLVVDPQTHRAAVVDPVLDYDQRTGKASAKSADRIIDRATVLGAAIDWVLETHVHADHLSGAPYIKVKTGAKVVIGERIREVQKIFRPVFNALDVSGEGSEFDKLVKDGDRLPLGDLTIDVIATPGHTPACVSYRIGNMVFVGDTLFMPDYGTARADFPGGDARTLYRSVRRVLELPAEMRLFMCHDYGPNGRDIEWETTVAKERAHNVHVRDGVSEDEFVLMREKRDALLPMPKLIIPSLQVNMRAGRMPPADKDGKTYLKVPVNGL